MASIRQGTEYVQQLCKNVRLLMVQGDASPLSKNQTDLHVWWSGVSALIRSALPGHIELVADLPADLPKVKLDRPLVTQIVFNLAHNAGRAMKRQATGQLHISAAASDDQANVRICISDNGPGMTPEVKRRCLEMSFSTHEEESASGIGLALVNSIVNRAAGSIEIDSELGRGTTFTIVLPAASADGVHH